MVEKDGKVVAESDAEYGCREPALRDAMCWQTLMLVVKSDCRGHNLSMGVSIVVEYSPGGEPDSPVFADEDAIAV